LPLTLSGMNFQTDAFAQGLTSPFQQSLGQGLDFQGAGCSQGGLPQGHSTLLQTPNCLLQNPNAMTQTQSRPAIHPGPKRIHADAKNILAGLTFSQGAFAGIQTNIYGLPDAFNMAPPQNTSVLQHSYSEVQLAGINSGNWAGEVNWTDKTGPSRWLFQRIGFTR
jgi:hypothetical protein